MTDNVMCFLPTANTQNRYNESSNGTFDIILPFAFFREEMWTTFSYCDSSGPLSESRAFDKLDDSPFTFDFAGEYSFI